jgi:2-succinyl-6-hydroxy-2,4-cyclohexadiene-1-carboxylate synthase
MFHIAIHGYLGASKDFDQLLPPASARRILALFDGDALRSGETKEEWLSRISASLQNEPRPRALIGYSLGGRIALELFAMAPEEYERVVILSAHPGLSSEDERRAREKSDAAWAAKFREMDELALLEEWNAQPVFAGSAPLESLPRCPRDVLARTLTEFSLGRQADFSPLIGEHCCKFTWVVGELDQKFLSVARSLKTKYPALDLLVVPARGHRLLVDPPRDLRRVCE